MRELILNFGSPCAQLDSPTSRQVPQVCLVGLQAKPLLLRVDGAVKIIAVRFFVWGVLPFLTRRVQLGGTTRVELDPMWRRVVSKAAAQVRRGAYQEAVEKVEDFLISKRLTALFDPRQ